MVKGLIQFIMSNLVFQVVQGAGVLCIVRASVILVAVLATVRAYSSARTTLQHRVPQNSVVLLKRIAVDMVRQ
jgi:hypothetical protein